MEYNRVIKNAIGINIRARYFNKDNGEYFPFETPLIHKEINGRVIVPLDTLRLWGK